VKSYGASTVAYATIRSVRIGRQHDEMGRVARRDCPKMALIHRQEQLNSEAFRGRNDGSIGEPHVEIPDEIRALIRREIEWRSAVRRWSDRSACQC
jgi:hypothetical protein